MKGYAWMAILSALNLAFALLLGAAAAVQESWPWLAYAGIEAVVGVGLAMLALRE